MNLKTIQITKEKFFIDKTVSSITFTESADKNSLVVFVRNGKDATTMSMSRADIALLEEFLNTREGR